LPTHFQLFVWLNTEEKSIILKKKYNYFSYLNDRVPELSEKHKGQAQYPTSYGFGQDFPIVIIK